MAKALVYGNDINTDLIIPGKYTKTLDLQELAKHCMEDVDPSFSERIEPGDVVVAGTNFGCGSSREQAPLALKAAGVSAVIAKSFARIFYRNAINVGLPVLTCDTSDIRDGDVVSFDLETGVIHTGADKEFLSEPFPAVMRQILSEGGLVPYLKKHGDFQI